MVDADNPLWVNEHVAAELVDVAARFLEPSPLDQQLRVHPKRSRTKNLPSGTAVHPIGLVEASCLVDQQRPVELRFANIGHGERSELEGDHADADIRGAEFFRMLSQLRQVFSTGKSAKMPMKYQQEPVASEVVKAVHCPGRVCQVKRDSVLSGHFHFGHYGQRIFKA